MMSKRKAEDETESSVPYKKVHFNPPLIGPISSLEQMDITVLKFKNKKLVECINRRIRIENELRDQIEKLEKRQKQNDTILAVVNRYWNQLNEDVCVQLRSFDAQSADELQVKKEDAENRSFLGQLSSCNRAELNEELTHRLLISKRAVSKMFQVIGRVLQRNENIALAFKGGVCDKPTAPSTGDGAEGTESNNCDIVPRIDEVLQQTHIEIMAENRNLHECNTSLREKFQQISLDMNRYKDALSVKVTENDDLKKRIAELQYTLERSRNRNDKLENHLADSIERLNTYQQMHGDLTMANASTLTASSSNDVSIVEELQFNLSEYRELANNRLQELNKLYNTHSEKVTELDKLKMELSHLPESVIIETPKYKSLQSEFSILCNESLLVKKMLDETREQLQTSKDHHMRQIKSIQIKNSNTEKMMRTEMIRMEHKLAKTRTEYENMRIEFEHKNTANEMTAPIHRENFLLCETLRSEINQLQRYKNRTQRDTRTLRQEIYECLTNLGAGNKVCIKCIDARVEPVSESEIVHDLRAELRRVQDNQQDMNQLLSLYKNVSRDGDDNERLIKMKTKLRCDVDQLQKELNKLQNIPRPDYKKLADKEALDRITQLEAQTNELHMLFRSYGNFFESSEEDELLKEVAVTAQKLKEMQDQNVRLLQLLRAKTDNSLKLMSENMQASHKCKVLHEASATLEHQVALRDAEIQVIYKESHQLRGKVRHLQATLAATEKKLALDQEAITTQSSELNKSVESIADLKQELQKSNAEVKDAQQVVAEKTTSLDAETFKTKRLQEEVDLLKRKVEYIMKIKKTAPAIDEVMQEELRECKETLTCPSCKANRKDAVLTRCFHAFCYDCLHKRYEMRQRRCPKCNCSFGLNDYHRLYY